MLSLYAWFDPTALGYCVLTSIIEAISWVRSLVIMIVQNYMYISWFRIFKNFLYQGGVKFPVFWVFEDLKFKTSEGYDPNWCFPDSAKLAVSAEQSGKHQFGSESSEILNLRSSTTPETVALMPPWYQCCFSIGEHAASALHSIQIFTKCSAIEHRVLYLDFSLKHT